MKSGYQMTLSFSEVRELVLFKSACSGPRVIHGQSESEPKVPVQLAVLGTSVEVDGRSWSDDRAKQRGFLSGHTRRREGAQKQLDSDSGHDT